MCPTFCDPMDCSPPGSSVHGILQAITLDWVAISFSHMLNIYIHTHSTYGICICCLVLRFLHLKYSLEGTSLVVQWLRLCVPNVGGPGSTPGQGTGSHTPQLEVLCAAIKTWSSQIHIKNCIKKYSMDIFPCKHLKKDFIIL